MPTSIKGIIEARSSGRRRRLGVVRQAPGSTFVSASRDAKKCGSFGGLPRETDAAMRNFYWNSASKARKATRGTGRASRSGALRQAHLP